MSDQAAFGPSGGESDVKVPENKAPGCKTKSSMDVVMVPDNPKEPTQGRPSEGIDLQKQSEDFTDPLCLG